MKISRRQLLLASAGTAFAASSAGLWHLQPQAHHITGRPGRPRFATPLRVTVIGGGLAGLSAALELAERGARVTLCERSPQLGGKLSGWPITALGERFAMEHGFHGFFAQYYNLRDCLERFHATPELQPITSYSLLSADGASDDFRGGRGLFPFNLLALYQRSPNLHWRGALSKSAEMQALLAYDPATVATFDQQSFSEFARGLDGNLVRTMLAPFAKTTLNHPDRLSAAYALMFMHFYFLGNPSGLGYDFTRNDCMSSVITPWAEHLRALGVDIKTSCAVTALEREAGAIAGVRIGSSATQALLAQIPADLDAVARQIGESTSGVPIFAWQTPSGPVAVLGACTHQGCPVRLASDGFLCPCHGGRYDREARPVAGPPQRPLSRLTVLDDGRVVAPVEASSVIAADEIVIACDVPGARALIGPQPGLKEADPYLVVRLWLDRQPAPSRHVFYTTRGFALLDSIALTDRLQGPYTAYAARSGHSVVELHAYAMDAAHDRGPEKNADTLFAELLSAFPELHDARVLHREVMQQNNFSGFPPGSLLRPRTHTADANLFLAGDWVRSDLPVALMEAAVTTGRLAANAICEKHGVASASITTVAQRGAIA